MSMHPAGEAYTLQDYLQWEGDWELIRGQPVAMVPSPSFEHQQVSAAIFRQLDESLDDCPHCQAVFLSASLPCLGQSVIDLATQPF
jgi:hypothetical protein